MMELDLDQIKQVMSALQESQMTKLVIKKGDFELHLEKEQAPPPPLQAVARAPVAEPLSSPEAPRVDEGSYVTSPMVGTFYASPGPEEPPFVKVGERVFADSVICIVEAMKVMNEVKAGVAGVVAEVLCDNARPVEFGTRLFRIV